MENRPDVDLRLFNKFLNNQCSEAEREAVLHWLSDPANEKLAAQMMETHWAVVNATDEFKEIDVDHLLLSTREQISEFSEPNLLPDPDTRTPWLKRNARLLLAACVVILISARIILVYFNDTSSGTTESITEISTSSQEITEVILPDGTKVKLNAQSSISYADSFLRQPKREVTLTGEAFFDVTEDPAHPFIVRTQAINIVVLGTSFNLKSYEDDATIETILVKGKVLIEDRLKPSRKVRLSPNQKAIFSRLNNNISTLNLQADDLVTWTDQTIHFRNEELSKVIKTLERWYGISIRVDDQTDTSCKLTATLDKNALPETLEIFKSLVGIDYTIHGQEVRIRGKLCNQ